MEKLTVCHVRSHRGPRETKLAYCQKKNGKVTPLWIGLAGNEYQTTMPFERAIEPPPGQKGLFLKKAVEIINKSVDVYHVHNEPDWLITAMKELTSKPVVWDVHDLNSLRTGITREDERLAFELADGILTVNQELAAIIRSKTERDIPIGQYPSYCPMDWMPPPIQEPNGPDIIIATGLNPLAGHYRNWFSCFDEILDSGFTLVCYSGAIKDYHNLFRYRYEIKEPIDIIELLGAYSNAHYGLAGAPNHNPLMSLATPNKPFEYIAAGIPVIVFGRHHKMLETFERLEIGIGIDYMSELPDAIEHAKRTKMRESVIQNRTLFTMDRHEPLVFDFYGDVLDREKT